MGPWKGLKRDTKERQQEGKDRRERDKETKGPRERKSKREQQNE